ncbi:hypothetical protein SRHO_G00319200 [Serrasalmus rhombeus]
MTGLISWPASSYWQAPLCERKQALGKREENSPQYQTLGSIKAEEDIRPERESENLKEHKSSEGQSREVRMKEYCGLSRRMRGEEDGNRIKKLE